MKNRELWKLLWQDCVQLHSDLGALNYFHESEERVVLMNATAPEFFSWLQQTMWQAMFLQVCRFTDPAKTSGKDNLSLHFLLQATVSDRSDIDQRRVLKLVEEAVSRSEFARDWRNKWIAHRDLLVAIYVNLRASATLLQMRHSVSAIAAAMDAMDPAGAQTAWDTNWSMQGCRVLLLYLQEGLISHNERRAACERGELMWGEIWSKSAP